LQATGELCLARGDWQGACVEAGRLTELAGQSSQRTYLGIAQYIRAAAANAQGAEVDLDSFVDCDSPIADWRLHSLAAGIAESKGQEERAREHKALSRRALNSLAQSMPSGEPLAASVRRRIATL
jgi:hypothetical protein